MQHPHTYTRSPSQLSTTSLAASPPDSPVRAQLLLKLNVAAGSVTCPMYIQWASKDVLTCRDAAQSWRTQRGAKAWSWLCSKLGYAAAAGGAGAGAGAGGEARGHVRVEARGDVPGGGKLVAGETVGAGAWLQGAGVATGGAVHRTQDFTWEEIPDGAMHVMIHGRRGPALVAGIREWLRRQLEAGGGLAGGGFQQAPARGGVQKVPSCESRSATSRASSLEQLNVATGAASSCRSDGECTMHAMRERERELSMLLGGSDSEDDEGEEEGVATGGGWWGAWWTMWGGPSAGGGGVATGACKRARASGGAPDAAPPSMHGALAGGAAAAATCVKRRRRDSVHVASGQ